MTTEWKRDGKSTHRAANGRIRMRVIKIADRYWAITVTPPRRECGWKSVESTLRDAKAECEHMAQRMAFRGEG